MGATRGTLKAVQRTLEQELREAYKEIGRLTAELHQQANDHTISQMKIGARVDELEQALREAKRGILMALEQLKDEVEHGAHDRRIVARLRELAGVTS